MSDHGEAVATLTQLGFNSTDARIYVALLEENPATGYDLSSRAGVPRSAVYGALSRLEQEGIVSPLPGKPARYLPLPSAELLKRLAAEFVERRTELERSLVALQRREPTYATFTVPGYDALLEQARLLIGESQRSVFASLWAREARAVAGELSAAKQRGNEIVLFSFTELSPALGRLFCYGISESELERHWSHRLILICDRRRALLGAAEPGVNSRAVLTEEPALVEMAISTLVLDITLLGQRRGIDTSETVQQLTSALAPLEELGRC